MCKVKDFVEGENSIEGEKIGKRESLTFLTTVACYHTRSCWTELAVFSMLRQQVLYAEIEAGEVQHLKEVWVCGSSRQSEDCGPCIMVQRRVFRTMMEERSTGGRTVVDLTSFEDNSGFVEGDILVQTGIISGCERRPLALKAWPRNQGSVK